MTLLKQPKKKEEVRNNNNKKKNQKSTFIIVLWSIKTLSRAAEQWNYDLCVRKSQGCGIRTLFPAFEGSNLYNHYCM